MNATRQEADAFLRDHDGYLILTHQRPDGDAVGSAVALCLALRKLGKTAFVLPNPDATALFDPYWGDTLASEDYAPRTVITVDMAGENLFPANAEGYKGKVALAIDHHPSNTGYAALSCVEADKAACGEILCDLLRPWGVLDREIALALYLAVSTDTGCFLYSNTTPHTHRVAAELMETGIDVGEVNRRHFRTKSYARLQVEARIMDTLELHDDGAIALASVTLDDVDRIHAREEDLDNISAFIGQLEGVRTAVTIREERCGECHISVRTGPELNASKVCALLGGGGHAAAGGCNVRGTAADARREILAAIRAVQAGG